MWFCVVVVSLRINRVFVNIFLNGSIEIVSVLKWEVGFKYVVWIEFFGLGKMLFYVVIGSCGFKKGKLSYVLFVFVLFVINKIFYFD